MKVLIVDNGVIGETVKIIIDTKTSTSLCTHENALEIFLLEDPKYVLIFESWKEQCELSVTTANDIQNSARPEVVIKTIGFDKNNDFVMPIDLYDIIKEVNLTQK